jgi:hypothetical protein
VVKKPQYRRGQGSNMGCSAIGKMATMLEKEARQFIYNTKLLLDSWNISVYLFLKFTLLNVCHLEEVSKKKSWRRNNTNKHFILNICTVTSVVCGFRKYIN